MERLGDQDQDITKDVVVEAFEHWSLQVFDIFSRSAKSGRRFPISPRPALFFPTQFEAGMTYEEQAGDNNRVKLFAQTRFGNDLFEVQPNTYQICLAGLIYH